MKVFVSYKHTDHLFVNDIRSVRLNSNHDLAFDDSSLSDPVYNSQGHVNRRAPLDPASKDVRDEIEYLLRRTDKYILLLGNDTHSSLWVMWEYETFKKLKGIKNIYVMRTRNNNRGGLPANVDPRLDAHNWDLNALVRWLKD